MIEWAGAIKLTLMMTLLIGLFLPWGMASVFSWPAIMLALVLWIAKLGVVAMVLAFVESSVAKLRMYLVPDFLGVASALAILAVVFTALMR